MFRPAVAFSAWTVFSFLCHYAAKEFLHQAGARLLLTCLLTAAQLISCYVFLSHGPAGGSKPGVSDAPRWAYGLAMVTHVAATFSTNYSLALLYAPSTLTIKLLEPLMSALVVWLVMGKPVSSQTLIALVLLIVGALGFVGNPLASLSLGAGTVLALISNMLYGLRNILIKHFMNTDMQLCDAAEYVVYSAVGVVAMWLCNQDAALLIMLLSAVCHVIYSYISTNIILHELSVVAHAVANISKRLLVVLLMVAAGQKNLEMHK
jgi:drug/metabolite transporter (DMT)-like permease